MLRSNWGEETTFKTTAMLLSTNKKRILMTRHSKRRRTGKKKKTKNLTRQKKTCFARLVAMPRPVGVPKKVATAHRPSAKRSSKYCV